MKITQDVREYAATLGMEVHLRHRSRHGAKSAEFRQRGGEVYLPVDSVVAAEAEETVAAD